MNDPLITSPQKLREKYGTQVAELMPYEAKTWRVEVNIGLMVRRFYQSNLLHIKFWLNGIGHMVF